MRALRLTELAPEALRKLDRLYRTTHDPRLRTRVHIILLAAEKGLTAAEIAEIVRSDEQTVRRWIKRYQNQGLEGLYDAPRPGGPHKLSDEQLAELLEIARRPPSELGLSFSRWTAAHLAEYAATHFGVKVNPETIRLHLKAAGINLKPTAEITPAGSRKPRNLLKSRTRNTHK